MKSENVGIWQTLRFIFPDNAAISFDARIADSVIKELTLDTGQPVFKLRCSINELYQPNTQIFTSGFPYNDLWFRYAQILVIEKHLKLQVPVGIELIRVIFCEFLRIAEYIFNLATLCLNGGLNDIFSGLMQQYESIQQYFEQILSGTNPMDFIIGHKTPEDLTVGFTEMTLNLSHQLQIQLRKSLPHLLNNRLILSRFSKIADQIADNSAILNDKLEFDQTRFTSSKKHNNVYWQLLKIRCDDLFRSIGLIRLSLTKFVYLDRSPQTLPSLTSLPKGNSSVNIETPWGKLSCQMNCPGDRNPCDFILSNPLHKIQLLLCKMAVGLELDELPLLITSLGLRPKIDPR